MPDPEQPISLISADRTAEGVLVVFSDYTTVLFKTDFLYKNHNADGNEEHEDIPDEHEDIPDMPD
jgi:hypothetical protein